VRSQFSSAKACLVFCSIAVGASLFAKNAAAEKILAHDGDWTLYSDGRVGAFASYVHGDGYPNPPVSLAGGSGNTYYYGLPYGTPLYAMWGGGMLATTAVPVATGPVERSPAGTIERMRIRSGMIANTFGFGVRGPVDGDTTVKGYIQLWAWVENFNQDKTQLNQADMRQGYVKLESPKWGSVLVGRSRSLFARGNTDNDVMYAHGYGVGYPGAVDSNGPTQGQIGFGILGSGFCSGIVYATPSLGGLQLSIGAFDPVHINGAWTRTKYVRPEAELNFERPIGNVGKFALFANGVWERLYIPGHPDSENTTVKGIGYGGRVELGPARLGVAAHYGRGLGTNYALESSAAAVSPQNDLRIIDGYAVQGMVVLGRFDVFAGWGITRIFLNSEDLVGYASKSINPTYNTGIDVIKQQQGISAGAIFHVKPWLHIDVDLFRANFAWFLGEKQVDYIANSGMMFTW
jgi:hypothetical protein